MPSSSSRTREANDSTYGFCQGERLDVGAAGAAEAAPVAERVRGQLGAVVAADVLGRASAVGDETIEHPDGRVGVDPPLALDRQRR
jgi:hypothetical protein